MRNVSGEDLVTASRRLARSIRPGDLFSTLEQITAAAVEVLDTVDYASITMLHGGRLESFAPTDPLICEVDRVQHDLMEGPCYAAAVSSQPVLAPHLAEDGRFPRYAPRASALGIQAQAGLPMFESVNFHGAINLYARDPSAFEQLGSLETMFTAQTAMAVSYAQEVSNLHEAVRTRQVIGQAVGMLMERHQFSTEDAFAFLTQLSQHRNVKVRVLAQQILDETPHIRLSR